MTDISVIILTGNEELHIKRCLEKLAPLEPRQVFIVESQKGDNTHEIAISTAKSLGWRVNDLTQARPDVVVPSAEQSEDGRNAPKKAELSKGRLRSNGEAALKGPRHTRQVETFACDEVACVLNLIWHDWPKLQSTQFNWALDNLPIEGEWVLRLDADEYLTPGTIKKLKQFLCSPPPSTSTSGNEVAGLTLELKRRFCGGEIRHATTGIRQVRMFRRGKGRYAETLMDERIVVEGGVLDFDGAFYDDNLNDMDWWRAKHRGYAKREAQQAIESMESGHWVDPRKASYYKIPPYLRAFVYFAIRHFLKGGFLDGYAGWMWNFWQGLWYRCLVDYEIGKLEDA